jgi:hypothetical protein
MKNLLKDLFEEDADKLKKSAEDLGISPETLKRLITALRNLMGAGKTASKPRASALKWPVRLKKRSKISVLSTVIYSATRLKRRPRCSLASLSDTSMTRLATRPRKST